MKSGYIFFVRYYSYAIGASDWNVSVWTRHWMAVVLLFMCTGQSVGQRFFSLEINDQPRGYLLTAPGGESPNLPLVIVLHANGSSAMQTFRSDSLWKKLSRPALLVFPLSKGGTWSCLDSMGSGGNQNFLSALIDQVYENYQADRNRVYMIASGEGYCFIQDFYKNHQVKVAGVFEYSVMPEEDEQSIVTAIDLLLPAAPEKDMGYQLWQKVRLSDKSEEEIRIDSLKRNRWERRIGIAVKASRFVMLSIVKTGIDDKTYMDISDAKRLYTFEVTKWINDSMGLFIDVSWLQIPTKQEVSFDSDGINVRIKGEGGGGAIVPVAIGFKYALHRYAFRPYFQVGAGPMAVFVVGGKFRARSMNIDPSAIRNNLESESRLVIHFSLGSGYEWRLGKRFYNTGELKYLHSGRFDSAGQVNAIKGFSIGLGFGYILGIKKQLNAF